jgi:hypothetical protein
MIKMILVRLNGIKHYINGDAVLLFIGLGVANKRDISKPPLLAVATLIFEILMS